MTPKEFIARLETIATEARHHPEPAAAVALLAQLLLDLAVSLEPLAEKYALVLQASGFPGELAGAVEQVRSDLQSTTIETPVGEFNPDLDTTGTAG